MLDRRSPARWRSSPPSGRRRRCCSRWSPDIDRDLPVLMIDSLMLFEETLAYQRDARAAPRAAQRAASPALTRPTSRALDPDDTLHQRDPDACCDIRKVLPLDRALRRWPVSITGRKRFQASTRDRARRSSSATATRLKVNPLAALDGRRTSAPTWTRTTCRGTRWSPGASVDRLRALHDAGGAGRGRPRRPLARQREGRVRHSFRRGWPHPARGELRRRT